MSENQKKKSRTYARNRTRLNRRGFEKNPERDGIFLLKLFLSVLAGFFWIKFSGVLQIGGVLLAGLPFGAILAIFLISKFEKRSENFSHGFSGSHGYQNGLRKPSQRAVTRTPLA
jgi:hypothetical protein